jgi:branched-chain amino acid aminotransferase
MYYNENTIVYWNGKFVKATDAKGNLYDQTLHYGYGVFEGIRSYNTQNGVQIFKALEHYDRMQASCEAVAIPYPYNNEELIQISYEVLKRNGFTDAYLRPLVTCTPNMTLTRGKESQLLIAAWEWGAYLGDKLLTICTSPFRRPNPAAFKVHAKVTGHYVNSILACQDAKDRGFDEALLLDVNGYVAEGPGANFFYEKDNVLYTPQLGNILPGITRATVIEIATAAGIEVVEKQITPEEVKRADAAFFCGTAAEVIGIKKLDDYLFPLAWSSSLGEKIQKAYRNLVLDKKQDAQLIRA